MSENRLRPEIASSWRRALLSGLSPDEPPRVDVQQEPPESRLTQAADPVLSALLEDLGGTSSGLLFADQDATIRDVRATSSAVRDWLVGLGGVVGARFSEDNVGTTSIGTSIEVHRGVAVHGEEHFAEAYRTFGCYGQPVVHPITGRQVGVLDISFDDRDDNRVFEALVRRAARDIGRRLADVSPRSHHALADAFGAARRRGGAVVALGDEITLATPAALELLGPEDHVVLRVSADELQRGGVPASTLQLGDGREYALGWNAAEEGVIVELRALHAPSGSSAARGVLYPALVSGERGSGRSTAARRLAGPGAAVLDAATAVSDPGGFSALIRAAFDGPRPLVIEDAHLLPEALLAAMLRQAERGVPRVVFTLATNEASEEVAAVLGAGVPHRAHLEPLRRRRHEIPELATRMLATAPGGVRRSFAPDALRVLSSQTWPGNLAELRRVVELMAETPGDGVLHASDIPSSHREPAPLPTPRAEAERDIILAAIRSADGNRRRAAELLGVSRSTLYNRMRVLHIEA